MNDTKAEKRDWNALSVSILLVAVVVFSSIFMYKMINILDAHSPLRERTVTTVISAACTNEVRVFNSPSSCVNRSQYESPAIIAAYEALQNELSTWMAIMGIFAAIFGLVIPLGGYLLQRQSLKDERDAMSKEIERIRGIDGRIDTALGRIDATEARLKPVEDAVGGTANTFWKAVGRCFEYAVITNKYAREKIHFPECVEIANLILAMELNFDCCVLAHDKKGLDQQFGYSRIILESLKMSRGEDLAQAYALLKSDTRQRTPLVDGLRYLEMLGSSNELYKGLKHFFDEFDSTKLP